MCIRDRRGGLVGHWHRVYGRPSGVKSHAHVVACRGVTGGKWQDPIARVSSPSSGQPRSGDYRVVHPGLEHRRRHVAQSLSLPLSSWFAPSPAGAHHQAAPLFRSDAGQSQTAAQGRGSSDHCSATSQPGSLRRQPSERIRRCHRAATLSSPRPESSNEFRPPRAVKCPDFLQSSR